jgi:hypothetical protein
MSVLFAADDWWARGVGAVGICLGGLSLLLNYLKYRHDKIEKERDRLERREKETERVELKLSFGRGMLGRTMQVNVVNPSTTLKVPIKSVRLECDETTRPPTSIGGNLAQSIRSSVDLRAFVGRQLQHGPIDLDPRKSIDFYLVLQPVGPLHHFASQAPELLSIVVRSHTGEVGRLSGEPVHHCLKTALAQRPPANSGGEQGG